jgi:hypothetical protein
MSETIGFTNFEMDCPAVSLTHYIDLTNGGDNFLARRMHMRTSMEGGLFSSKQLL